MSNKKSNGKIPVHFLNQLNEYTLGGFVLFYYNAETGVPELVSTYDTPAHCLGLQKYIQDWSEALHEVCITNAANSIQSALDDDDSVDSDDQSTKGENGLTNG